MARKSRKNIPVEAPVQTKVYIRTAMYIRLSVEDNHNRGNSLDNQQLIIRDYLADKPELEIVGTYIDNGLSGMNFDRPDFQRLLADIEAGRIDCVIVKDLSRLGRNFIDTSYYPAPWSIILCRRASRSLARCCSISLRRRSYRACLCSS